jgi:ElaA protein
MEWSTLAFSELSTASLYALLRLRQDVFAIEQDCLYRDIDDLDQQAFHMLCCKNSEILAYQRCLPPGLSFPESALGRIVVCQAMREQRLGRELVRRGIEHNLSRWPGIDICINAQSHLQAFYTSLGFVGEGNEHLEDGILHRHMRYGATHTDSKAR